MEIPPPSHLPRSRMMQRHTRAAWLRDAAQALRASRKLAVQLDLPGGPRRDLAVLRLRIDHALLEVEFLRRGVVGD